MGRLADNAFAPQSLRDAWLEVLANDREDGTLSYGVARFAENPEDQIAELSRSLLDGSYTPRPLTEVEITLGDKVRTLHIPTVVDRIAARAVLDATTPFIDPELGPCAYAYRPGLGVSDAVQSLVRLRDEGLGWVLRTDVHDCFPSVPAGLAVRRFAELVPDPVLGGLVERFTART